MRKLPAFENYNGVQYMTGAGILSASISFNNGVHSRQTVVVSGVSYLSLFKQVLFNILEITGVTLAGNNFLKKENI